MFDDNGYLDITFVILGLPLCIIIPIYHCYSFIYAYKLSKIQKDVEKTATTESSSKQAEKSKSDTYNFPSKDENHGIIYYYVMGAHIITLIGVLSATINGISSSILGSHFPILSHNTNCEIFGTIALASWSISKSTVYFIGTICETHEFCVN